MIKNYFATSAVLTSAFLIGAGSASADIVAQYDFTNSGENGGWDLVNATRSVPGNGLLKGTVSGASNDPQMVRTLANAVSRGAAQTWENVNITVRELLANGTTPVVDTPYDATGVVLIFNTQIGATATNFGGPTSVTAADANGFRTLTWSVSTFTSQSTGGIRLDPIGGASTGGHIFEVDQITLTAVPEPASLALVALGAFAMLGRRRK